MGRNASGVYSLPAGSTVANGDTSDASDLNTPFQDLELDNNSARPVIAGGTGATTASVARTNLGVPGKADAETISGNWTVSGDWTVTGAWEFPNLSVTSTSANEVSITTTVDDANDASLIFKKARGGATPAQITAGDDLGTIGFRGYDGSTYQVGAFIRADSTANTGNLGGNLIFGTNGSNAVTIDENQGVTFAGYITFDGTTITEFLDEDDMASDSATGIPSQQSVKAYIASLLGHSATWQDVSGSRAHSTSYQNTLAYQIDVAITGTGANIYAQASSDGSTWVNIGIFEPGAVSQTYITVPPGHYYRVNGAATISIWAERR